MIEALSTDTFFYTVSINQRIQTPNLKVFF